MAVRTSAGAIISLTAGVPATIDSTGYAALTYTALGEVVDIGELGRIYTIVTHNPVGNRSTQKLKGSFDEGKLSLMVGLDEADAGQVLAQAALLLDNPYAFKIVLQSTKILYFQGLISGFKKQVGGVNKITSVAMTVDITTSSTGVGIILV